MSAAVMERPAVEAPEKFEHAEWCDTHDYAGGGEGSCYSAPDVIGTCSGDQVKVDAIQSFSPDADGQPAPNAAAVGLYLGNGFGADLTVEEAVALATALLEQARHLAGPDGMPVAVGPGFEMWATRGMD